ncbi:hypothetical protein [Aeromonas allosaccharophila]|uniref:hypothetical protein n=1 Tax=Aeromonas allosaccharophila TaxID=656 RepID=UPI002AE0317D|nr:hypothetical protein [Aeromonas allosaccharophila]
MKTWAFYKEGETWHPIGINAALAREKEAPGLWQRRTYYSTHSPEHIRLRMNIRKSSKGNYSFAYNPGQDDEIERLGGGESLAHYLYKIAISELKHTTLKIKNLENDIIINIIDSQTEKHVSMDGRDYYIDVYLKFDSPSKYQLKWGGELGIEVHNTNPVKGQKLKDLQAIGIPIIEVDVNEKLAYRKSEEYSTPELERSYIEFIKMRFSEYLRGRILSNPNTKEYLEEENLQLKNQVDFLTAALSKAKEECTEMKEKNTNFISDNAQKSNLILQLEAAKKDFESQLKNFQNMGILKYIWYWLTRKETK